MEEIEVITLENGEDYGIINTCLHDNTKYLLLSNLSNSKDICIRKIINENNKEYITRLNDKELEMVLNLFIKENKDITGNN